jgi:glucose 1-dehydrogenase
MFAVGMVRGKTGVYDFDLPVPQIKAPDEVLVRVKEVGLDGTDFNMVGYNLQDIPQGSDRMAIGHEGAGIVEAVGSGVSSLKPGDPVVITVRRGCGECSPCLHNASDMCQTGRFKERGLHKLDGFLTQFIVDKEQYMTRVPENLVNLAVLTEPVSIIEKGIEQLRIIQSRLPWTCPHAEHSFLSPNWGGCKIALVIGAGALGLIAIALLRIAGVTVYTCDVVPEDSPKIKLAHRMGGGYIDARTKSPTELIEAGAGEGNMDILFEASGAASTALELIKYMSRSSIYVLTGIPREEVLMQIDAAQLVRQIVRYNQVVVGSVNSNRSHFEMALRDMQKINTEFSGALESMLTQRCKLEDYPQAFAPKDSEHIKTVIEVEAWK